MDNKKENIIIGEQDLFALVFFPENVSDEKRIKIESDYSFDEILNFYSELQKDAAAKIDNSLKQKIAAKIPAYTLENVIQLYALKEPIITNQNGHRLAAGSTELKPKMTTKTFVDNDKEYLIKVLNYGDNTKVFVFSTKDEVVKNFDIIIEPNNLKFHFKDNTEPLKIDKVIEADTIRLEII